MCLYVHYILYILHILKDIYKNIPNGTIHNSPKSENVTLYSNENYWYNATAWIILRYVTLSKGKKKQKEYILYDSPFVKGKNRQQWLMVTEVSFLTTLGAVTEGARGWNLGC